MHFNGQTFSSVFEQFSFTSKCFGVKKAKNDFYRKKGFESKFLPKFNVFLVLFTIFHFDLEKFTGRNCKYLLVTRNLYIFGQTTSKYCSQIIVVHVHATGCF